MIMMNGIFALNHGKIALEVKETATEFHYQSTCSLAKNLGIDEVYVVGRNAVHNFPGFIWGGLIS